MDWFKAKEGVEGFPPEKDPGVQSVTSIYNYFKKHGYQTVVMGASFRNKGEILQLAGCDRLTMAPKLVDELADSTEEVVKMLDEDEARKLDIPEIDMHEELFRWMLNENAMATEKLAEGIRKFAADARELEKVVKEKM